MYWEPIGGLSSSSSRILNATFTALISFCIAFHQRSFPSSLSKAKACSTVLGALIPNLCVILWYLLLTAAMILCLFFRTWVVHQENACSSLILHILQPQQNMTPSCHSIFPMKLTCLSTLCRVATLLWSSVCRFAIQCNMLVVVANYLGVLSLINNVIHEPVLVTFNVTMSIHAFCNDVCSQFCILTI